MTTEHPPQKQELPPPQEAIKQAGGGLSGEQHGQIKTVSSTVLPYLERIFKCHADTSQKAWNAEQASTFIRYTQAGDPGKVSDGFPAELVGKEELDFNDFLKYMTSDATSVVAPLSDQDGDLGYPLSSYFISSSHNTYLTGNQLSSDASADAYKNVLLRGCRCIEIDVWDGDDSASETSSSSDSEHDLDGDSPAKAAKRAKRKKTVETAKSKLPTSMLHKLEKTSLGKKLEKYVEKKTEPRRSTPSPHAAKSDANDTGLKATPTITSEKPAATIAALIEPRVLHGHTLTKEVSFRQVCTTIQEHAFTVTDLPLIVSLEVHAGPQQQEIMVEIMKELWTGLLLEPPKQEPDVLPSPSDLRRKILVKVKYAPPGIEAPASPSGSEEDLSSTGPSAPGAIKADAKKKKKPSKIIQALSDLGIHARAVSFKSLQQPEATMPGHVFSLGENTVFDVHEKQGQQLFEHNRKYLMRAYPSGIRVGSSNVDPATFWRKGIQIAALNWQNWDKGMMLNEGMFAGSGGYMLKPPGYRQSKPNTPAETSHVKHRTLDLEIQVFAAQSLPLPPGTSVKSFDPYLKIELHVEAGGERHGHFPSDGHDCDTTTAASAKAAAVAAFSKHNSEDDEEQEGEYKSRLKTVKGTRDPDFKGEVVEFKTIPGVVEELSFVRFLVRDDERFQRDDLAAWACVRLDRLRMGYRFVMLMDAKGKQSEGMILIKVMKKVY